MRKDTGRHVDPDDVVRGFEIEKGKYVPIEDEDLDRLDIELTHSIDILDFADLEEIDPIYYRKAYYLLPQDGAEKPYRLLARALEETGKVGIAKVVIRNKQHLAALRPYEGVLLLETMYYSDEVRKPERVDGSGTRVQKAEVEMAKSLVENLSDGFDPKKYDDTYRKELLGLIRKKAKGARAAGAGRGRGGGGRRPDGRAARVGQGDEEGEDAQEGRAQGKLAAWRKPKLAEYKRKRDPKKTPEPFGGKKRGKEPIFVVQRHDARRLHYDFRLERNGALASWAVPKGIPLEPGQQHLAVHVEDHPLEYATFEGEIPKGEYGAGTVEIWDKGTYELVEEKKNGGLTVRLHGKRLNGTYALVPAHLSGDDEELAHPPQEGRCGAEPRGSRASTRRCSPRSPTPCPGERAGSTRSSGTATGSSRPSPAASPSCGRARTRTTRSASRTSRRSSSRR